MQTRILVPGHQDRRYLQLQEAWGNRYQASLFRFYQYQGLSVFVLALVFAVIAANPAPLGPLGWIGAGLIAAGIGGEGLADRQLQAWRAKPENHGKTCRAGLWAFSRHPNYFFEIWVWLGWALMALSTPLWGPLGLVPFAVMSGALIFFTGIPANEAANLPSKPDYAAYQREVSALIPWFPKRS